jgi:hypothetical protein
LKPNPLTQLRLDDIQPTGRDAYLAQFESSNSTDENGKWQTFSNLFYLFLYFLCLGHSYLTGGRSTFLSQNTVLIVRSM